MKPPRAFATVANQLADPVVITDPQGRVEWVNEPFTALCGYTPAELKGRKPGDLLQGPATDPEAVSALRRAVRLARPLSVELINYHKNGEPYSVWISLNPLRDHAGGLVGFMAIERETSSLHRELRRLETEVTELYAIVCHVCADQAA